MSALGQKQTFAMQNVMSALTPKADMCGALADVRLVPKADILPPPALALRLGSRDEFLDYGGALAYSASAVFFQSAFGNAI